MEKFNPKLPIPPKMKKTIKNCSKGLGGVGLVGGVVGAGADTVVILPIWVGMTVKLAEQAGHKLSADIAKKILLAVISGTGFFLGGTKAASTVLAWVTAPFTGGLSLVLAAGANATLNLTFTRLYGNAVARYFLQTKISNTWMMKKVLIALVGYGMGIDTPYDDFLEEV